MELTQLGKYRLLHLIATGGMGEVYLSRMEGPAGFAKNVVVKRVLPHLARDPNFVEMFLNEARLAAILSHPNIVQIFELGEQDGSYYIAMEFVNGRSLKAIKQTLLGQQQIVSPVFAARVCAQALNGLHYAHELCDDEGTPLNIVHRDMSPDNVLVTFGGEVKVVDFGIAKASNAVTTTRTGTLKGKYAYMAPEQLNGQHVDARADIFAMGIVLYELLCGFRPFRGATEPALIQAILNAPAKAPHIANPNVPFELSEISLRALQKDPRDRYQTAEEMAVAIETYLQSLGQPLTASHIGSLLKSLFPDGDKVRTDPNAAVVQANKETILYKGPVPGDAPPAKVPPPGSSPSLVKPLPKGASSPDLPSPSQLAAAQPPPAKSPARTLLTAGAFGLGVGLIGAVAFIALRAPAPQPEKPAEVIANKPEEKKAEPVVEKKPEEKPVIAVVEDEKPPEKKEAPVKTAVDKTAKKPEVKKVVAKNGKVTLRVNPYAEVFYGGKSLGVTPMAPVEVPSGTQTFTLKNAELKITRQVTVKVPPGGSVVLKADLFDG